MPRFISAKALANYLRRAEAETQKEAVITSQSWLGRSDNHPVDSGRMISNWFATSGVPATTTSAALNQPRNDAQQLEVRPGSTYFLTNNLVYAQPVALGINLPPSWGGQPRAWRQQEGDDDSTGAVDTNWFKNFLSVRIPDIQEEAARTIKRRFQL